MGTHMAPGGMETWLGRCDMCRGPTAKVLYADWDPLEIHYMLLYCVREELVFGKWIWQPEEESDVAHM